MMAPAAIRGHSFNRHSSPVNLTLARVLQHERERRQAFMSVLAHELRQPLSTLSAAIEVMRCTPDPMAASRVIERMERQIDQMTRAVEDLLDETRWVRGKLSLRKQRVDLRQIVTAAATDVAGAVAAREHVIVVSAGDTPLWAEVDVQRLHQVLSNLLRNAVKYTEPGGRISLVTERTETTVRISVADTGRGIAAAALPTIFDLFSQVQPSEAIGVGVGLSVAREIVRLHNGRIEARSPGIGRGSTFVVTLPLL